MRFSQWLRKQHKRDDAIGDLARDMKQDREWPRIRKETLDRYESYLKYERYAYEKAIITLRAAWQEWQNVNV
jgi:hypothetical protein